MDSDIPLEGRVSATAHGIVDALFQTVTRDFETPSMYEDTEPLDTGAVRQAMLAGEEPEYDEKLYACDKYDVATLELRDEQTRTEFASADHDTFEWWWHRIISTFEQHVPNWETSVNLVTYNDHGDQKFIITSSHSLFGDSLHEVYDEDLLEERKEQRERDELLKSMGVREEDDEPDAPKLGTDRLDAPDEPPYDDAESHIDFGIEFDPGMRVKTHFLLRTTGDWTPITYKDFSSLSVGSESYLHGQVDTVLEFEPLASVLSRRSTLSPSESKVALMDGHGYGKWTRSLCENSPSTVRSYRSNGKKKADDEVKGSHFTREVIDRGLRTGLVPIHTCTRIPTDVGELLVAEGTPLSDRSLRWEAFHRHANPQNASAEFVEFTTDSAVLRLSEGVDVGTHYYVLDTRDITSTYHTFLSASSSHGRWVADEA